jgi:Putative phage abortive infection protein
MTDELDSAGEISAATTHVNRLTTLAYVGFSAAIVVVGFFVYKFFGPLSDDPGKWGQFGDYVGGVLNPTFSFLALLALLATLGLQIRELRISARELKNSADALVLQNDTLRQQTFEATFFQLLRLHNDIVASMEVLSDSLKGRACFAHYLKQLESLLRIEAATTNRDRFVLYYDIFYRDHQAALGHYFRLLYNIVKLVKRTEGIDRHFYTNLVRAQLSSAELQLLFYNCLSTWGSEKFKPLVEEFALLKTIPNDTVPKDELLHQYLPSAFGGKYPESWL